MKNKTVFNYAKDEVRDFLLNLELITTGGMELILERCFKLQKEYKLYDVLVQLSGEVNPVGIIIDVYDCEGDFITSETYWFDDLNEL